MRWTCPEAHLVVVSILYLILFECMFDPRACDLNFMNVERLN